MHKLAVPFGIKAVSGRVIEGHGSVFGNVDLGADIVLPGSFKRSLSEHEAAGTMPAMLWQHQSDQIPGAWTQAGEDDDGLALKGELADTQLGRESQTLARMRAFRGLSIGGLIGDFDFDKKGNRLIKEFDLWEVSLVTFPMNPQAQIEAVKSQFSSPRALEKHLREVGCSQKAAKDIVHDLLGSSERLETDQREVDDDLLKAAEHLNQVATAALIRSQLRRQLNGKSHCRGNAETGRNSQPVSGNQ
jgi:uncharacterized protein